MNKSTKIILALAIIAVVAYTIISKLPERPVVSHDPQIINEDTYTQESLTLSNGTYLAQENSVINWQGRRPLIKGYMDNGTLGIKNAELVYTDGAITNGTLTFDMTSITAQSTGRGAGEDMLSGHLKSPDFFDVEKYPEASLTVNSITNGVLEGELTIKEITQPVSFPVYISQNENDMNLSGSVELDRTLWNVQYGSGKFFDNLKEQLVDDIFTVTFNVNFIMSQTETTE